MPGVRAAIEVDDQAVALELKRRDSDTVAGSGRLPFFVEHVFVGCVRRAHVAVGNKLNAGTGGEFAMGKALLGFKVADEIEAAAFVEWSIGDFDVRGVKLGSDVFGGGFFADNEYLSAHQRG